eukprot:16345009-Heterocapsa_arctica.AAC.1
MPGRLIGDGNVTRIQPFRPPPPEALTGASTGTGQAPTPFRTPPGFSPSPRRQTIIGPAPPVRLLPCPQCLVLNNKFAALEAKFYASAADPNAKI